MTRDLLSRCSHSKQVKQIQARLVTSGLLLASVFHHNALLRAHSRTASASPSVSPAAAFPIYTHLLRRGLRPDSYTLPFLLNFCSLLLARYHGLSVHAHAIRLGRDADLFLANALIHFYSVVRDLAAARRILDLASFTDVVSYNSMLTGYLRAGDLDSAWSLFDGMSETNVVTWSAMISGCLQGGRSKEALALFSRMQAEGPEPNDMTLVSVLAACAHLGALEQGKWIHSYLRSNGIKISVFLGTALIDMYAKCGQVQLALNLFDEMPEKNLLTWTTMIKGLAMHGNGVEALQLFSVMGASGFVPDDVAFIGALCACTHAGLVDQGREIFDSMRKDYGIEPKLEHYGCMVDLLARNGLLEEAQGLIKSMPMEPDALVWGALMAGCKLHRNVELAEHSVKHLIKLEPDSSGVYVLLANIYASSGRHDKAREVRCMMRTKRLQKTPGCSLVEIGGRIHQFLVGDIAHPLIKDILSKWEEIESLIKLEGYVPDKKEVLLNIDDEEKEDALARHSEKLAIAFALISTEEGMPIRVVKNLRVCSDCHQVTKLISKVYCREIIVRDRTRFHLFKGGSCSCNNYW
ncbi:putative pentatricopeptide repeat-containing protein At5g40405 [Zingiber officinale]|uniref:putative pentatricopeptide repeat-containing protein At5g40405 n=1 Tax=Zingiber officinale TaxID=94328 RepID=UPI001C4CB356|nr:putative pentatricopeptide repeat-containing protein At5g40405 [Zingiber officinale]XP_042421080.1 putative pentatricopeptide repeat-containing protein At5g40405 [Zingiber officinale]